VNPNGARTDGIVKGDFFSGTWPTAESEASLRLAPPLQVSPRYSTNRVSLRDIRGAGWPVQDRELTAKVGYLLSI